MHEFAGKCHIETGTTFRIIDGSESEAWIEFIKTNGGGTINAELRIEGPQRRMRGTKMERNFICLFHSLIVKDKA